MVMETGATTGIFPSDERTRESLTLQGRKQEWVALAAEPGAVNSDTETIRLNGVRADELEPLIALPSSPGNVVSVREAAGVATQQVCVGVRSTRPSPTSRSSQPRCADGRCLPNSN